MRAKISQLPAWGTQQMEVCPLLPQRMKVSLPLMEMARASSLSVMSPVLRETIRFIVVRMMLRRTMVLSLSARSFGSKIMRRLRATILRLEGMAAHTK